MAKGKTPQLSREDWVKAARRQLVAGGIDEVKVDRLARKLKVTRGSFYWHFRNRKDLLDAILESWVTLKEAEIERAREGWSSTGPIEVARIWLSADPTYPAFDMAIRFWAWKSPPVMKIVRGIDDRWIAFLARQFEADGQQELESVARARVLYWHQVGYYALRFEEPMAERLRFLPYYTQILIGTVPGEELEGIVSELHPAAGRRSRGKGPAGAKRTPPA